MQTKIKCQHCGKKANVQRRSAKYCSANCRNKAAYMRNVKAELERLGESLELKGE